MKKEYTHYELCRITAERFLKESEIILYEYQNMVTGEFPDVLCFNGSYSRLFEIKVDYRDFKRDSQKDCRRRLRIRYLPQLHINYSYENYRSKEKERYIAYKKDLTEYIEQCPHLGRQRYYVCPSNLIHPDEINNGFGLYWYNGKFSLKKRSEKFRHDIFAEMNIILHAFRKYGNGHQDNILIRQYLKNY